MKQKYLLIILVLVLTVNLVVWLLADVLLLGRFERLEDEDARRQFARVIAVLEREGQFLETWGESRALRLAERLSLAPLSEVAPATLPELLLEAADIDLAGIVLADQDKIADIMIAGGTDALTGLGSAAHRDLLLEMVGTPGFAGARYGLHWYDGAVYAVAVVSLQHGGASSGWLVLMRHLNPGILDKLRDTMQADFVLTASGGSVGTASPGPAVVQRQENKLRITGTVNDLLGTGSVRVSLSLDRDIVAAGRNMVHYYQLWLLVISSAVGLVAWPLLSRHRAKRDREALLDRAIRDSSEALVLCTPGGVVVLANPQASQLFGVSDAELAGQRLDDLLGAAGDKSNWRTLLNQALHPDSNHERLRFVNQKGRVVVGEVICNRLQFDGEDHLLLQIRDISRREAAEEALRLAHERYRQLFEHAPLPMWMVDLESLEIIDVNQTAVGAYGYPREEFLGMAFSELHLSQDRARLQGLFSDPDLRHEPLDLWRHRLRDGTLVDVEVALSTMFFAGREVALVVAHDVTEQQLLRRGAERIARLAALGELVAGVAHEINNPNGMILRNLDFVGAVLDDALPLLAGQAQDEDLQLGGLDYQRVCSQLPQLVADMQRGADHIRAIVRDMKDFARDDEDAVNQPFDLNEATAAAVRLLDGALRKATGALTLELAEDLPRPVGSSRQVEQVVINLLMNACQALPDFRCGITVRTRHDRAHQRVLVEVIDQGRGIAREDLERITDPFYTTRREQGGTGLGLSISSRIVRQHGGTLDFISEPGQGTHVTLSLPVVA